MSKLSARRKAALNKADSWVEPSFNDLLLHSSLGLLATKKSAKCADSKSRTQSLTSVSSSKRPAKRKAEQRQVSELSSQQDDPWVDKHAPVTQADLAVHKKKIEEVENWLKHHTDGAVKKTGGAILLLTGPSGCGKTATVQVLARELGCQLQEWYNPSTVGEFRTEEPCMDTFDPAFKFNGFSRGSQTTVFQEFLLRANKYSCLTMLGEKRSSDGKIILIEDIPNQFYRQPDCLHRILRRFVRTGRNPLVFIISDSLSGDSNSRLLFPRDIQDELGVCNISFNPVAPTSMMKVLSKITTQESSMNRGRFLALSKADLELLCTGSSGDIRSAINSLQFSSLTDHSAHNIEWPVKISKPSSVKSRSRDKSKLAKISQQKDTVQAIGGKDAALFLFRALGKILYCKRESHQDSQQPLLPSHLSEHQRDAMLVDPELVVEKSHMSAELFNLYLQQNYVDFYSEVEDVARASEYLSDADYLTADWTARPTMREYSTSVATRGLIHTNTSQVPVGFRPLHKPHWLLISKKYRENCQAAKSLFVSYCISPLGLQTELLPYLAQLNNPMRNQAQIAFIQDVGRLPLRRYPGRLKFEALSDKDPGTVTLDSEEEEGVGADVGTRVDTVDELPASQTQPTSAQDEEEEQLVIEEYDSD